MLDEEDKHIIVMYVMSLIKSYLANTEASIRFEPSRLIDVDLTHVWCVHQHLAPGSVTEHYMFGFRLSSAAHFLVVDYSMWSSLRKFSLLDKDNIEFKKFVIKKFDEVNQQRRGLHEIRY